MSKPKTKAKSPVNRPTVAAKSRTAPKSKPAIKKESTLGAEEQSVSESPKNTGIAVQLHAPSARDVCVAGTFNGWNAGADPLSRGDGGEWRRELPLPVGRYEYLFVVDGTWIPDPAAPESVPNEFGGMNSVLSVN